MERFSDGSEDLREVVVDVVVREAEHAITGGRERLVARSISRGLHRMIVGRTIDLDDEPRPATHEVEDDLPERMLRAESSPIEAPALQMRPKLAL